MRTFHRVFLITLWTVIAAILVACAGGASQARSTQTPIVVVVTGATPNIDPSQPTETPLPSVFPTPFICNAQIIEQPFEHGRMFWVGKTLEERCQEQHDFTPGSGEIWVAIFNSSGQSGEWFAFEDDWNEESDIPFDITVTQPAGLLQPVRGFGNVWREKLSAEQRQSLGWATYQELAFTSTYRYDAGGFVDDQGTYVPRPGQHVIITLAGERFFLDEQTGQFDYVPN